MGGLKGEEEKGGGRMERKGKKVAKQRGEDGSERRGDGIKGKGSQG